MRRVSFYALIGLGFILGTPAVARPLVAVIDSGVGQTAELQPVLVAEYDMAAEPQRPAFQPRYNHGTQVSTVLNREAGGQVDIISLRIDDPAGCPEGASPPCQPSARVIANAIYKAIELKVDAINMSLSMMDSPAIDKAVFMAARQGITVVMAAGNAGRDRPGNLGMAKAGYPNTVLVGALDASGAPWPGTNRPEPGAALPYNYVWRYGVDVPTANADGTPAHATGTSLAAPAETAHRMIQKPVVMAAAAATH